MKRLAILTVLLLLLSACTQDYVDPKTPRATLGNPQAQVVIEEFGDFECPACGVAYQALKSVKEKYSERVLWRFYNYPLIQIHPYAFNASLAAECANDQGKYWEYHDILYENQESLATEDLYSYAEKVGLNPDSFKNCFKSKAKSSLIKQDMDMGDSRGIDATPTFFLNGEKLLDFSAIESRLDTIFAPL